MKAKRIIGLIALIVIMLAVNLNGQLLYQQNKNRAVNGWLKDSWYFFERGETVSSANVEFENMLLADTVYTAIYKAYPYMYLTQTVEDTNAVDSVYYKVELWMSDKTDTTKFMFVKNLLWNNQDGSTQNATNIDAVGEWWSNVGASEYPGLDNFYLRYVPLTKHRVKGEGSDHTDRGYGHVLAK